VAGDRRGILSSPEKRGGPGGGGGGGGVVDRVEARDRLLSVRQRVEPERESFLPAPLASEL